MSKQDDPYGAKRAYVALSKYVSHTLGKAPGTNGFDFEFLLSKGEPVKQRGGKRKRRKRKRKR